MDAGVKDWMQNKMAEMSGRFEKHAKITGQEAERKRRPVHYRGSNYKQRHTNLWQMDKK